MENKGGFSSCGIFLERIQPSAADFLTVDFCHCGHFKGMVFKFKSLASASIMKIKVVLVIT